MSRVGKNPVVVPDGVNVTVNGQKIEAQGKLGKLDLVVHDDVSVKMEDGDNGKTIVFAPRNNSRQAKMLYPTMRQLTQGIVTGVSEGFSKSLEIQGVGYRAQMQGNTLVLALGYSHDVKYAIPEGVKVELDGQTKIKVSGIDKQKVGQVAAEIRDYRRPEPYKGKGVRYEGEYVARKEGKKK